MAQNTRLNAHFSGFVQGVGFRATTFSIARRLPVSGFVKNLPDGSVELVAEGKKEDLETLLQGLRSQMDRLIQQVQTEWESGSGEFPDFSIRF